ncbi:hypothetical protein BJ878DRAFT_572243 [Calycina marina]|uniref:C2H2-type domain-containing protein n=1 Tax=Calycina marina TaxID=1763456 RepID=A0A9P8CIS0_9HELO|nr:hypothetical protein BJ878DRAFT_572243 [Calycina marina]
MSAEPSSKKRRLAPKMDDPDMLLEESSQPYYQAIPSLQEAPPPPERTEFESFARHLQDAAMLLYAQANRSPYRTVSVLLLRWEDDLSVEEDVQDLEKIFREQYNYQTESWCIPSTPNPTAKLSMQMAQHMEFARSDHLLIVYYTGYGFVGPDHHLYWACNAREDSTRLKWDGIRCLLEDAQSDILLLLDSCAVADAGTAGGHGVKQALAAYTPEHSQRETGPRSFTSYLVEALGKLGTGRPFTIQRLHEEIISQKHTRLLQQNNGLSNGSGKSVSAANERMPVCFTLTPGTLQSISLSPLGGQVADSASPLGALDGLMSQPEPHGVRINTSAELTFEEPRALVCTTFLGEPSQDMTSFKHWLHNTPVAAAKIAVEGMFHGPPTVLLVSMPIAIWNVIAADRTCCFLGYVNSHNMTTEYHHLIGGIAPYNKAATRRELEDGKILLEAREAAASTPVMVRHEASLQHDPLLLNTPNGSQMMYPDPNPPQEHHGVEDSVEMHEAAEQLKALSHPRHVSHDHLGGNLSHLASEESPKMRDPREESISSHDHGDSANDDGLYNSEYHSPNTIRPKPRRSTQKQGPKQDTRCSMCSHAPFKDSSSLRKHIAAAHTRPFPCAFSFAGCTSTFGSKNEWKRHIASQHLCLTYYRCSSCTQSTVEGKGNEFNRKDLFTQHLRRMHAPFAIKKAIAKGDSKLNLEWESHVKEMQVNCLVIRRQPPQRSACPKVDCSNVFEGTGSWDDWTEHVGRHMEKGEANRLGVDRLLARWALEEGIIERKEDGEYRLCGTERDGGATISGGYYSDGNGGIMSGKREMLDDGIGDGSILMDG